MSNYFERDHPFIGHQWWLSVVEGGHYWSKYDLGWPLKSFRGPPVISYVIRPNYHDHNDRWVLWMFYNSVLRVYAPDYTFHSKMISNEQKDVEQSALKITVILKEFGIYGNRTFDSIVRFHNLHFISCWRLSLISCWVFEWVGKPFPICRAEKRYFRKYQWVTVAWEHQIENQMTLLNSNNKPAFPWCASNEILFFNSQSKSISCPNISTIDFGASWSKIWNSILKSIQDHFQFFWRQIILIRGWDLFLHFGIFFNSFACPFFNQLHLELILWYFIFWTCRSSIFRNFQRF